MEKRDILLAEVLKLINKYSLTAYDIAQGTGISAVGIQKIINGESKRPLERTLESITSYIKEKYSIENDKSYELNKVINIKSLPHAEQMELLQNEILELKKELKEQREENEINTQKIIEFVDEYIKPVFDFMQETLENKKKDNVK